MLLVAGLAERAGDGFYNTSVLIGPEGYIGKYRKVHLFFEEKRWFQPGDLGFPVWDVGGVRIGMMICFDWVFPEAARSLTLQGAEIICHPVNLVLPYCQEAMVTRCIENGVFAVTANRIGSEERGGKNRLTFTGGSQAVDPRGNVLFRLRDAEEACREVEIDPTKAGDKMITEHNHLLEDRRPESYR
jgi:predicted amidohydrolase